MVVVPRRTPTQKALPLLCDENTSWNTQLSKTQKVRDQLPQYHIIGVSEDNSHNKISKFKFRTQKFVTIVL